jgi:Glycosyl transferase family 2
MVYKVRDEADIIEDNLRFHLAQGVDFFVIVDTGSVDGTLEILERYEEGGLVRLERTVGGIHDMKAGGEEGITRIAAEMGADWIVHNDADEFWWPAAGNLKQTFEAIPEEFGMVLAPRTEFVMRPGEGPFVDRMTVREARFRRPAKSAHRPSDRIRLRGPHPVEIWAGEPYRGLVGKPVLRTQAEHREDDPLELVIAPTFPVGVLHFPFRTFEQYRRRAEIARDNGQLERNEAGRAVRKALKDGRLEEIYDRLTLDDDQVARGIEEGWLIEQTSFRDYLAACPDPLADAEVPAPAVPTDGGSPTAEELRDDSMYAISRYLQTQAERAAARRRQSARVREFRQRLKARNRSLRTRTNRLRRVESSLWWRIRPRLPRGLARLPRSLRRRRRSRRRG